MIELIASKSLDFDVQEKRGDANLKEKTMKKLSLKWPIGAAVLLGLYASPSGAVEFTDMNIKPLSSEKCLTVNIKMDSVGLGV